MSASIFLPSRCRRWIPAVLCLGLCVGGGVWFYRGQGREGGREKSRQATAVERQIDQVRIDVDLSPEKGALADPADRVLPENGIAPGQAEAGRGSLDEAVTEAMHRIVCLTEEQAALPQNEGVSHFVSNPGQDLTARFESRGGVKFQSGRNGKSWQGTLTYSRGSGSWEASGTRLERVAGDGAVEWYENKPEGIEHGFTLARRPDASGAEHGVARLSLTLQGLRAAADPERPGDLLFYDPATAEPVMGYQKLIVRDASGKTLPSHMEAAGPGVLIAWQDAGAQYPVTVDPLAVSFAQGMDDPDGAANDNAGLFTALDGDTAVIGTLNDDTPAGVNAGSVLVFRKVGTVWNLESKLYNPAAGPNDRFGVALGVSGNTIIVGSDYDDENGLTDNGSAAIFVRNSTVWSAQGAKLVPPGTSNQAGRAVAIDGNTVVIGGPGASSGSGRAWIYARSGTTWTLQTTLSSAIPQNNANFGFAVDVHGSRVIVGEPRRSGFLTPSTVNPNHGQASVYHLEGAFWTRKSAFSAPDLQTGEQLGFAVAIHGDMAVMGGPGTPVGWTGATPAHVNSRGRTFYSRYSGTWSSPGAVPGPALTDGAYFGFAVDVQNDVVAIAALGMEGNRGRVYLNSYRAGGTWAVQPSLQPPGLAITTWFGTGVSLSGNHVLAGAHGGGTSNAGRAFVFNVNPVEDASINVSASGLAVDTPAPESFVAIRSVPGKEGFRIPISGSLQRWDSLDVPLPVPAPAGGNYFPATFDVKFRVVLHNETDNINVPLQNAGLVTQPVTAPAFVLNGNLRSPYLIPAARTLDAVPVNAGEILPNKSYRFTVTVSHMDGAAEVVDVSRILTGVRLISFSGQMDFGAVNTTLTAVTGNPAAGGVVQFTPLHFRISVTIPAGGAHVTANPSQTFGGGPLTMRYTFSGANQGDLRMDGSQTVQVLAAGSGSTAGVGWSRGPVLLTVNGPQTSNFRVRLPAGLGYANYAATIGRRMKGSAVVNVGLNTSLEPAGSVTITGPGGILLVSHERLPAWLVTTGLTWDIAAGTFTGVPTASGNVGAVHCRIDETNSLIATAQAQPLEEGDNGIRMANDGYFGRGSIAGQNLVVRVSPEGRALLNYTCQATHPGFQAHFPKGLTVPAGQASLTWQNSEVSGTMTQAGTTPATLTYATVAPDSPACVTGNAALTSRSVNFSATGGVWQITPDGGLRAAGAIASADVGWGLNNGSPQTFTHTVRGVTTGVMAMAGISLRSTVYQVAQNEGAGYQAAAMLLSGHGSPGDTALVERPGENDYDFGLSGNAAAGSADYPGFNFRANNPGAPVLRAVSHIAGKTVPASGAYDLKPHSKYYLRPGGVTGVHDAVTAQILPMPQFYDYLISLNGLRLSYLDCRNEQSAVSGSVALPAPAGFSLNFSQLILTSTGDLARVELANSNSLRMSYWDMEIRPGAMEFASADECAINGRKLVLAVTGRMPAVTDDPLQARLGFEPTGELVTGGEANGMPTDSRFTLPAQLSIKGINGSRYTLTSVSKAALNSHGFSGAPSDGFVSFAGTLAVPFFADIPVHVIATPSDDGTQDTSLVQLTGGWSEGAGRTFFNDVNFDPTNRGFPVGVSFENYQNTVDPAHRPVAHYNWRGVANLDYPLQWDAGGRFFNGAGDDEDEFLVIEVKHQVQTLTNEGCAITFGAGFETPQLSLASLATEALTGGLSEVLPDAEGMLEGIDGLEKLLTDRFERTIGAGVDQALEDTVAAAIVEDLERFYGDQNPAPGIRKFAGLTAGMFSNNANADAIRTRLMTLVSRDGPVPGRIFTDIENALSGALQSCALARQILNDGGGSYQVVQQIVAALSQFSETTDPITGVPADVMEGAQVGLAEAVRLLDQVEARLRSMQGAGTTRDRLFAAFQSKAQAAANKAIDRVVAHYRDVHDITGEYMIEFSEEEHRQVVLGLLRQSVSGSELADAVQPVLRGAFREARAQFRSALNLVFSEINRLLNRASKGLVNAVTEDFTEMVGETGAVGTTAAGVGDFCAAARMDGCMHIDGEEIEEIRINARLKMKMAISLTVDGHFQLLNIDSNTPNTSCRLPGRVATEVTVGAAAAADFGPAFKVAVVLEGKCSFGYDKNEQGQDIGGLKLKGMDGSFDLKAKMPVKNGSLSHMAAKFGFGEGSGFISGQIEGTVYAFGANGTCFFGTTRNPADLNLLDAETRRVLEIPSPFIPGTSVIMPQLTCLDGPLTGFYTNMELEVSINALFGIMDTCALSIRGKFGSANFCFYRTKVKDKPAGHYLVPGVRFLYQVSGQVVCVLDLSAAAAIAVAAEIDITQVLEMDSLAELLEDPIAMAASLADATARGVGSITFTAGIGIDPFSVDFSHTLRVIMELSRQGVSVAFD